MFPSYIILNIFNSFPHSHLGLFHPYVVVIKALGITGFRGNLSAYYYTHDLAIKSALETLKLFATSLTASIMCSACPASILKAFI